MESATLANVGRRRMLGLGLDSWNNLIVVLAIFAGGFAVLAAIATYIAFQLQKQEAFDAAVSFARYKLETEAKIAEADARALEAKAQLEKLKSPRNLVRQSAMVNRLSKFKGTKFDMAVVPGDPEAALFVGQISKTLQLAGWEWVDFAGKNGPLTITLSWPGLPNVGQIGGFGVDIFIPSNHPELSTAAELLNVLLNEDGFSQRSAPAEAGAAQGFNNHDAIHVVVGKKLQ